MVLLTWKRGGGPAREGVVLGERSLSRESGGGPAREDVVL